MDIERSLVGLSMLAPLWRADSSVRSLITIEPDLELEYRLAELNSNSPIPLAYHPRAVYRGFRPREESASGENAIA